jgi:hypothetical protein
MHRAALAAAPPWRPRATAAATPTPSRLTGQGFDPLLQDNACLLTGSAWIQFSDPHGSSSRIRVLANDPDKTYFLENIENLYFIILKTFHVDHAIPYLLL